VIELPTPSRSAIEGAGFTIVEQRHPSYPNSVGSRFHL